MASLIDHEFDVTVVAVNPYGLSVEFADGKKGFIDNLKDAGFLSDSRGEVVGNVVHVVVLDDERDPIRLSALENDIEIGRRALKEGWEHEPINLEYLLKRRAEGTL